MRVLIDVSAVPARPVGAGVYTVELVRALDRLGEPDLVLLAREDDAVRWRAVAPGAEVHARVPVARPARLAWEQVGGPGLARRLGVDVWHGPHYTVPLRLAVPSVVTVHDLTFFEHPEWHERSKVLYFRRMLPRAARRAAVCVCVSAHTATGLARHVPDAAPAVVIHHGVDHARFLPADDAAGPEDLTALAALAIRPPYVAFTGTIEPRKGLPVLIEAFAGVAASRPDLRLVIAGGDGWGVEAARAAIADSGAATRILRTGYLSDAVLPAFLRRAEVVAYPSLEEGFGLPALEALACGTPLVTTSGSAVEELVGDSALLVATGDAAALGTALERALDPAVARRLRDAGPTRARTFTWERSAVAHRDAYRRAAGG